VVTRGQYRWWGTTGPRSSRRVSQITKRAAKRRAALPEIRARVRILAGSRICMDPLGIDRRLVYIPCETPRSAETPPELQNSMSVRTRKFESVELLRKSSAGDKEESHIAACVLASASDRNANGPKF